MLGLTFVGQTHKEGLIVTGDIHITGLDREVISFSHYFSLVDFYISHSTGTFGVTRPPFKLACGLHRLKTTTQCLRFKFLESKSIVRYLMFMRL
jgi:hypothetical protein